jgi:excisionase family DNA binding protein
MDDLDRAIPLRTACSDYLSISVAHCYRLMERGELRAVKNGGRTYIMASEVRRYLGSLRTVKPGAAA